MHNACLQLVFAMRSHTFAYLSRVGDWLLWQLRDSWKPRHTASCIIIGVLYLYISECGQVQTLLRLSTTSPISLAILSMDATSCSVNCCLGNGISRRESSLQNALEGQHTYHKYVDTQRIPYNAWTYLSQPRVTSINSEKSFKDSSTLEGSVLGALSPGIWHKKRRQGQKNIAQNSCNSLDQLWEELATWWRCTRPLWQSRKSSPTEVPIHHFEFFHISGKENRDYPCHVYE